MQNAIILAAGKGERLLSLTQKQPKPLFQLMNEPIIERQIRFLQEAKVDHITIVVGYLHDQFLYLKDKYSNIEIVINDLYKDSNNFYSLFLVRKMLKNTWIIEGDIFLLNNIFLRHATSVYYSSLKSVVEYEWYFEYDNFQKIRSIQIADRRMSPNKYDGYYYINMGISFWDSSSCLIINNLFEKIHRNKSEFSKYKSGYWDRLIFDYLDRFDVYVHLVNENEWYEIDSAEDLDEIKKTFGEIA